MVTNYGLGILLQILHSVIFSVVILLFFSLDYSIPIFQVFFFITLTGLIFMLPWLILTKKRYLKTKSYKLYMYRAIFNIMAALSWSEAMRFFHFNEICSIDYLTPIFTIIIITLFSYEKFNLKYFIVLWVNFIAIYFIFSPKHDFIFHEKVGIPIFAGFMWACYSTICKIQADSEENIFGQAFYTFFFTTLFSLPIIMLWKPVYILPLNMIFFMTILCLFSTLILFAAYKFTPLSVLMPFCYMKVIFMLCATYLLFGEKPGDLAIIGVAIICAALVYVIYRECRIISKKVNKTDV